MRNVIKVAVSLMVVALIIPLAIGLVSVAGDFAINSTHTLADVADPSIITLLTVLLPVMAIIGIILFFVPKSKSSA